MTCPLVPLLLSAALALAGLPAAAAAQEQPPKQLWDEFPLEPTATPATASPQATSSPRVVQVRERDDGMAPVALLALLVTAAGVGAIAAHMAARRLPRTPLPAATSTAGEVASTPAPTTNHTAGGQRGAATMPPSTPMNGLAPDASTAPARLFGLKPRPEGSPAPHRRFAPKTEPAQRGQEAPARGAKPQPGRLPGDAKPAPEARAEPAAAKAKPTRKRPAKPAAKRSAKPTRKRSAKPTPKKAAKPAAKGAAKPAAKQSAKPAVKRAAKPAVKRAANPAAKIAATPAATLAATPTPTQSPTPTPTQSPTPTPTQSPTPTPTQSPTPTPTPAARPAPQPAPGSPARSASRSPRAPSRSPAPRPAGSDRQTGRFAPGRTTRAGGASPPVPGRCSIKLSKRPPMGRFAAIADTGDRVLAWSPVFKLGPEEGENRPSPPEALGALVDELTAAGWRKTGAGRAPWDLHFERQPQGVVTRHGGPPHA
jgi:hypothetical protein